MFGIQEKVISFKVCEVIDLMCLYGGHSFVMSCLMRELKPFGMVTYLTIIVRMLDQLSLREYRQDITSWLRRNYLPR